MVSQVKQRMRAAAAHLHCLALLPTTRQVLLLTCAIVIPIAAVLLGIKVYKLVFALWPLTLNTAGWQQPTLIQGLLQFIHRSACILAVVFVVAFFVLRKRPRMPTFARLALSALVALAVLLVLHFFNALFGLTRASGMDVTWGTWLNTILKQAASEFHFTYGMFRSDLIFCLVYALVCVLAFSATSPRWLRTVFAMLVGVNVILLAIAGLELAHYLETGVTGTAPLFIYLLENVTDVLGMLQFQSNAPLHLVLISVPMVGLAITCFGIASPGLPPSRRKAVPTRKTVCRARTDRISLGKLLWPVGATVFLLIPPTSHGYSRLSGNTITGLARDLLLRSGMPADALLTGRNIIARTQDIRFAETPETQRQNVVLILLESVRADSTSLHNPQLDTTPYLRELSEKALVVDEMYAHIPRTSGAWLSVLQGIHPVTNSAMAYWGKQEAQDPSFPSLPRLLRPFGYQSAYFSPSHAEYENENQLLLNLGFDKLVTAENFDLDRKDYVNPFGFEDRIVIEPMFTWVDEQQKNERPFLLTVMTNVGHHRFTYPASWPRKEYAQNVSEEYNEYLNCIAYIDDFVKRVFRGFEQRNLLDNTIFVVVSDHGESFGEHGTRNRAVSVHEEVLRVPMLIRAPGLAQAPKRIQGPRSHVDILPTLAQLLGYRIEGGEPDGHTLLADVPGDREIFFTATLEESAIAMRRGSLKFTYRFNDKSVHAFDLTQDRAQRHDLIDTLSKDELDTAKQKMLRWYWSTHAAMTTLSKR